MHTDWLIPDWPAPQNVRAVFTTRQGGVSSPPWDTLNLGDHVGDVAANVATNRLQLKNTLGARTVFLQQVHGHAVLALDDATPDGLPADACVTTQRGMACSIMVADCLPVLLASMDGTVVAAAHAGWRGLAGQDGGYGVLESVFDAFYASFSPAAPVKPAQLAINTIAWLGPSIGPAAFEVGADVKAAFEFSQPEAARCFVAKGSGKYLADLAGLARLRLQALGITRVYGNDGTAPWCTAGNPEKFFSHRRDAAAGGNGLGNGFGTTGRMAACVWLA